jgi:hypothetical protein
MYREREAVRYLVYMDMGLDMVVSGLQRCGLAGKYLQG